MNPCCCMSVRTGTLVIGILNLITTLVMTILAGVVLGYGSIDWKSLSWESILALIGLGLYPIKFIASALLIHSVRKVSGDFDWLLAWKGNHYLTIPWLVVAIVHILFGIVCLILSSGGAQYIIQSVFSSVLGTWFWIVVFHYKGEAAFGGYERI